MIEIQISNLCAHQVRIGQTGVWVFCCVGSERTGLEHRLTYGVWRNVRGTCVALALILVNSDAETAIIGVVLLYEYLMPFMHGW